MVEIPLFHHLLPMQTPLRGWVQVLMCKVMQALVWHTYSCLFFIVISESLFLTLAAAAGSGFPLLTADAWHGNHWTHPFLFLEKHPSSGFEVAAARDSLLRLHSTTVYAHCQLFLCHALQCFYLFFIFRLSSCRFYRLLGYRPCADSCLQKRWYDVPRAAAHRISAYIFPFYPCSSR